MGISTAIIYALLVVIGYTTQIMKLFRKKKTEDVSLVFFTSAWLALISRIATMGFVIYETMNTTAIVLGTVEIIIFIGLSIIIGQLIWYRHLKHRVRHRSP